MALFVDEIKALQLAADLDGIKFHEQKVADNCKGLACHIPNALANMDAYSRNQLAQELNEAINPVIAKHRDKLVGKVKRCVEPYKRDDET